MACRARTAGEGDADAQSGASMSKLPKRAAGQAPDMLAQAKLFANSPEMARHTIVTSLIAQSRSFWRGTDEEIFAAAGYRDADDYWHVATSEPMKALSFAHLLAVHLIDPTERRNEFDRRSLVRIRIDSSLRFALKTGESWFIKDPLLSEGGGTCDLEALMLHPRAAAKWLFSRPKRRDLVPPGLKAFLEWTERPGERAVPALGPVEQEHLLAQSRAAATFDPRARRNTVLGLIRARTHGFSNRCPSIRLRTSCRCIAPRTPARLLFRSTACRCQCSTDANGRFSRRCARRRSQARHGSG